MFGIRYVPISHMDSSVLLPLMKEEEQVWLSDLGWDYAPIQQILLSFAQPKLLPGYAAVAGNRTVGYIYFLVNQTKGVIGSLYTSKAYKSQAIADELLSLSIACFRDSPDIHRIEAQIIPFHDQSFVEIFTQNGFTHYPRYYLDMNLDSYEGRQNDTIREKILPWDQSYLERAGELTLQSYQNQMDAEICEDYRSQTSCESYLNSMVKNPGCGIFMPEASYISLDATGEPCGYVICCRISDGFATIPQIVVHPSFQGRGLGDAMMDICLKQLQNLGFHSVSLTVTKKNSRAYEWYHRIGFKIRKEFGAFVWNARSTEMSDF